MYKHFDNDFVLFGFVFYSVDAAVDSFIEINTVICFVNFQCWNVWCFITAVVCVMNTPGEHCILVKRQSERVSSDANVVRLYGWWKRRPEWGWMRMVLLCCNASAIAVILPRQFISVVTTTIRLRFDGRSTAYQRSLRSQWCNPLAAVTLTYLFI